VHVTSHRDCVQHRGCCGKQGDAEGRVGGQVAHKAQGWLHDLGYGRVQAGGVQGQGQGDQKGRRTGQGCTHREQGSDAQPGSARRKGTM
jgi:hypothetical protein